MVKDKRLWIIFLIIFVNMLGFGIILPLLPYYVESLGAGPMTIGLLAATYSLFQLVSAPILGELSDKYGRRPILLFSIGGTALSFGLLGIANTIPLLFISRIIDGASGGNIATAQAYIADITSKKDRTQGMGTMMAAFSLGFILGPALGGVLSVYGYALPAYAASIVALVATILTYFFLPETQNTKKVTQVASRQHWKTFNIRTFFTTLTHPDVGVLLTIMFMMMFAFSLMQGTFALFSEHAFHLTAKDNGYLFGFLGLVGIIIQVFLLRRILTRISEQHTIVGSIGCMAIAFGLIALSNNILVLISAITLLALGNSLSGPILTGLISRKTPKNEQGSVAGMNQSVGSMARLLGPILGTYVYSTLGPRAPYFLASIILSFTIMYSTKQLFWNPCKS